MKLSGVRADPLATVRRRMALKSASEVVGVAVRDPDRSAFLGLADADMTPAVQGALTRLLSEIDELRHEVTRLKAHLAEAEGLADLDVLTPLLNRRAFMRELSRTVAFAQRYGSPACLIYFDLDGFKAVNDRFGHAAGDEALKAVAARLLAHVRESDVVGRIGGDEFGVILSHADEPTAAIKAASLAAAVEAEPVQCGDWMTPLHVTFGVRSISAESTADRILAEADAAMYLGKRARPHG